MRNQYESAQIFEVGRAQDLVLGQKIDDPDSFDVLIQQLGSIVIDETSDDE